MEHSDHWIMTGWHGEQWDFQNNEKTMEHSLDHDWMRTVGFTMLVFLQEEFLLSGPTDTLGMFVTSQGTSLRPPLSWTDGLITLGYSFPYVVAVGRGTITVYR